MLVKFLGSISIGFLIGILVHSAFFENQIPLLLIILISLFGLLLGFLRVFWLRVVAVGIIGFALGLLRYSYAIDMQKSTVLDVFVDQEQKMVVRGYIDSEPIAKNSYTEFVMHAYGIQTPSIDLSLDTRLLVKTDIYTDYQYGQHIETSAVVQKPESFVTDNNRIFDYQSYLKKDQIYYLMSFAQTQILDEGNPSIQRHLYALKNKFLGQIYRLLPEPESGLLAGVLFGQKSALGKEWEDVFRIVGLMHIVVLSGYNVSLVIQVFTRALRFLPLSVRSVLAVVSIIAFALLVGAGPTVIRASIMAGFIVLADLIGARYHIVRALFVAGLVMVIWNPLILYFDISFQLSFLATYGLIVWSPYFERWLHRLPKIFAIRDSAVATLSAQIMVLPVIAYHIGEFSLIAPVVNVLVLFAVPWSMLFGFITAVLGMIIPDLAVFFAFATSYVLSYQLWIAELFASLPFAYISFPPFHITVMVLVYLGIFGYLHLCPPSSRQEI